MKGGIIGLALFAAMAPAAAKSACLTNQEIDQAIGEQIRSGAFLVDTRSLGERPLCSGLTLAQQIQQMRAAAFPEEAQRAARERAAMVEQARSEMPAPTPAEARVEEGRMVRAEPVVHIHANRPRAVTPRKGSPPRKMQVAERGGGSAYYSSCRAARAAGAAPIRRGNPGYGRHLDRDGDGIACE